jgi:site-specific recombinase XerD
LTKTSEVVLCSTLAGELGKRRQADGYVFTMNGKPFTDWQQRCVLNDALERAGLDGAGSWHRLRHTFSSILENAGIPPSLIGQLLGHSPRGVTAAYTHPLREG